MIDQNQTKTSQKESEEPGEAANDVPKNTEQTTASGTSEFSNSNPLTPEEQMELYENQLKEDDWGHQPC